jgi:hypothetical protein
MVSAAAKLVHQRGPDVVLSLDRADEARETYVKWPGGCATCAGGFLENDRCAKQAIGSDRCLKSRKKAYPSAYRAKS